MTQRKYQRPLANRS